LARSMARQLAAAPDAPSGFVCSNEVAALGVMAGLRDAGRTPGKDVELVSRDGAYISDYLFPPLPTLFLDVRTVAATLCEFLLRRIQGESTKTLQRILPCELRYMELLRESADKDSCRKVVQSNPIVEPVPYSVVQDEEPLASTVSSH